MPKDCSISHSFYTFLTILRLRDCVKTTEPTKNIAVFIDLKAHGGFCITGLIELFFATTSRLAEKLSKCFLSVNVVHKTRENWFIVHQSGIKVILLNFRQGSVFTVLQEHLRKHQILGNKRCNINKTLKKTRYISGKSLG